VNPGDAEKPGTCRPGFSTNTAGSGEDGGLGLAVLLLGDVAFSFDSARVASSEAEFG
jgi:hypothetical protein